VRVSQWQDCWGSVIVSCCCEKLAARKTRGRGTSTVGSSHRVTPSEDVTVETSACVCVIVNCKAQSRAVPKSPINRIIIQTPSIVTLTSHMTISNTVYDPIHISFTFPQNWCYESLGRAHNWFLWGWGNGWIVSITVHCYDQETMFQVQWNDIH
jgi:hypothetical protein